MLFTLRGKKRMQVVYTTDAGDDDGNQWCWRTVFISFGADAVEGQDGVLTISQGGRTVHKRFKTSPIIGRNEPPPNLERRNWAYLLKFTDRAFSHAAPTIWNGLPTSVTLPPVHWNISNGHSKLNYTVVRLTVTDSWPPALKILPSEWLLVRYQPYNNNNNNNNGLKYCMKSFGR